MRPARKRADMESGVTLTTAPGYTPAVAGHVGAVGQEGGFARGTGRGPLDAPAPAGAPVRRPPARGMQQRMNGDQGAAVHELA